MKSFDPVMSHNSRSHEQKAVVWTSSELVNLHICQRAQCVLYVYWLCHVQCSHWVVEIVMLAQYGEHSGSDVPQSSVGVVLPRWASSASSCHRGRCHGSASRLGHHRFGERAMLLNAHATVLSLYKLIAFVWWRCM